MAKKGCFRYFGMCSRGLVCFWWAGDSWGTILDHKKIFRSTAFFLTLFVVKEDKYSVYMIMLNKYK